MADMTEVERFEPYTDEGNREGYGQMEPCEGGDWVRATDYDALAAKLAEAERAARYEANAVRQTIDQMKAEKARAEAAEAKLAEADALIEAQQKDYASNNVRFAEAEHRAKAAEAALPAVYRLAWEDAYQEHPFNAPTPAAAELMARIQTGEKE